MQADLLKSFSRHLNKLEGYPLTKTQMKLWNDANEIDTGNGALENAEENVEVSSRHSATQGSRKQRSSRRRQIEEMELENLRANKET